MKIIKSILTAIWKTWFILWFLLTFLFLYPFFLVTIKSRQLSLAFKIKRIWSYLISFGTGILPVLIYKAHSKKMPQPCVFVANHTSYLDIVLSTFYIDHLALYIGKVELLKAPLFRTFFKGMDIPVNRKSIKDSHKAFIKASQEIDKGRSMVIYPEGTISSNGQLKSFKNGPFKLAIEKQIPIVPVVYLNNWELLQNGGFFKSNGRPGLAKIVILNPIQTKGMTDENLVNLREQTFNLINDTLNEYNGTKNRY